MTSLYTVRLHYKKVNIKSKTKLNKQTKKSTNKQKNQLLVVRKNVQKTTLAQ